MKLATVFLICITSYYCFANDEDWGTDRVISLDILSDHPTEGVKRKDNAGRYPSYEFIIGPKYRVSRINEGPNNLILDIDDKREYCTKVRIYTFNNNPLFVKLNSRCKSENKEYHLIKTEGRWDLADKDNFNKEVAGINNDTIGYYFRFYTGKSDFAMPVKINLAIFLILTCIIFK